MKTLSLTVNSVQKSLGEEPRSIYFATEGKLYKKGQAVYILYDETALSGFEGNKTTLIIKSDVVVMHRYGTSPTRMRFMVGKREQSDYHTMYGSFKLEYLTHKLSVNLQENSGEITIEYDLAIKNLSQSSHTLTISYQLDAE